MTRGMAINAAIKIIEDLSEIAKEPGATTLKEIASHLRFVAQFYL